MAGKTSYANYKANYKQGYKYEVIKDYDLYLARNRDELALLQQGFTRFFSGTYSKKNGETVDSVVKFDLMHKEMWVEGFINAQTEATKK